MFSYDFFLAHAGPDAAEAERLYDLLDAETRVFLDTRSLVLGDDWDRALAEAQRSSRVTVVLVSANTDAAFYQREEIAAAIDLARTNEHRVVPVYLDAPPASVPYGLRLKHGVTVSDNSLIEQVAARLLDLHRTLIAGVPEPVTAHVKVPMSERSQPRTLSVRRALGELRDILAELISREDEAKRIVQDSGAAVGGAWWSSDPKSFWQGALDDAHRAFRMEELFTAVDDILGGNPEWQEAKQEYLAARDTDRSKHLRPVGDERPVTVSLTLNERRMHALEEALRRVVPTIFRDPRIAVDRLNKAKTALLAVDPFITAFGTAAMKETRQPMRYELQQLDHALRKQRMAVTQNLSALEEVRSEEAATKPCNDLSREASRLLDAYAQAINYVI